MARLNSGLSKMKTTLRNVRVTSKIVSGLLLALSFLVCSNISWAGVDTSEPSEKSIRRVILGVAAGLVRFDTSFKFTQKSSGRSVFVDGEGTLGLDETDTVPLLYGFYRFSKRHGIVFAGFQIKRESTRFQFDEDRDFDLGDITVPVGAQAKITLTDNTAFYYLAYNYALFDDKRNSLFASFGLYGLDLNYRLNAEGEISVEGEPVLRDSYSAEAGVFAPLPVFAIDAWSNFTKRWALGTRISIVGGSYQGVSALILDTSVRAKYQFYDWFGLSFGITYFRGDVEIDEPDLKTEVDYGYDGVAIGLDFSF